jgi:Mg/Co/Ni transporter MgtE
MEPDDAADLIVEIDQDRRGRILALLPPTQRRRIETLLGYNPSTAGGLMDPDFIRLAPSDTVAAALERLRASDEPAGTLTSVFIVDGDGQLFGSVFVVTLLRSDPGRPLAEIAERELPTVSTDAEVAEVARLMTDYNLVMLAVLDEQEQIVGVVTVDDVLELTLPSGWRRRFGVARD